MIKVCAVLAVCFAAWLFFGNPASVFLKPTQPSAKVPTFEESVARLAVLRQAADDGLLKEDPARREQRQAVLDAYEQLKENHCDKRVREDYINAIEPFLKSGLRSPPKLPTETFEIDGKLVSTTGFLDSEAKDTISTAIYSGYLKPEELPGAIGAAFARARKSPRAVAAMRSLATAESCNG